MLQRLRDVHRQHLGDVLPLELDLQRLLVEARARAHLALDPHVGQEVHLQFDGAMPLAGLAAPAAHIEAEPPGLVAASL